jgi:hypothetical protein
MCQPPGREKLQGRFEAPAANGLTIQALVHRNNAGVIGSLKYLGPGCGNGFREPKSDIGIVRVSSLY